MPWLGLGALCVAVGLGLSYLHAQAEADYALTMRIGPPEALPIAEAATSDAMTEEAHVIASFDPERALLVQIGTAGNRSSYYAVPLFEATDAGTEQGPVLATPRPRPTDPVRQLEEAYGLAVFPADAVAEIDALAAANDGRMFSGALNGARIPAEAFALDTAAVLAEASITLRSDFIAVEPWTQGRAAAFAPPPADPKQRWLPWIGFALIGVAIGLSLRPEGRLLEIHDDAKPAKVVTRSRILSDTQRFNPIVGQDDIRRGAMERLHKSERAQGRTPSSFFTSGTASKVGAGWVKNRR